MITEAWSLLETTFISHQAVRLRSCLEFSEPPLSDDYSKLATFKSTWARHCIKFYTFRSRFNEENTKNSLGVTLKWSEHNKNRYADDIFVFLHPSITLKKKGNSGSISWCCYKAHLYRFNWRGSFFALCETSNGFKSDIKDLNTLRNVIWRNREKLQRHLWCVRPKRQLCLGSTVLSFMPLFWEICHPATAGLQLGNSDATHNLRV